MQSAGFILNVLQAWKAFSLPPQGREELLLLPSTTERVEAILLVVHELYMIDPALVARVLPNLQAELVILARICSYLSCVFVSTSTCESFTKMWWQAF